jgi:hypothetical protein
MTGLTMPNNDGFVMGSKIQEQNFGCATLRFGKNATLNFDLTPFFAIDSIAPRAINTPTAGSKRSKNQGRTQSA